MTNLFNFRKEYAQGKLSIEDLESSPIDQFQKWFEQITLLGLPDPNAMVLSTSGADNRPSSRLVLLKEFSSEGFSFFTNYNSRKGKQIDENPYGCLLFAWHFLERQIRIEGKIKKLSAQKSDQYFENRPVRSRVGAWTSPQSEVIPSREYLEEREKNFRDEFNPDSVPRPPEWGGYILTPTTFEFWQGRENRLHDRFEYREEGSGWNIVRLAP
jgi:pyridoxamine 5'-phosphate oxidase